MKKRNVILLIVLGIVVTVFIVAGILIYKNWNVITAMYYHYSGNAEELEKNRDDADKRAEEAMKALGIENIRPLTEEETDKLNSGEISEDEAVKLVLGNEEETTDEQSENTEPQKDSENKTDSGNDKTSEAESSDNKTSPESEKTTGTQGAGSNAGKNDSSGSGNKTNTGKNDNVKEPEESPEIKAKKDRIAELIGKMYVLKSKFSKELSAIEDWVNSKYREFCKEYGGAENIPSSAKMKVGKKAYEDALALEASCDTEFYAILDEIETLLIETNQSTSVVSEIKSSYESEKKIAISYYMSQF